MDNRSHNAALRLLVVVLCMACPGTEALAEGRFLWEAASGRAAPRWFRIAMFPCDGSLSVQDVDGAGRVLDRAVLNTYEEIQQPDEPVSIFLDDAECRVALGALCFDAQTEDERARQLRRLNDQLERWGSATDMRNATLRIRPGMDAGTVYELDVVRQDGRIERFTYGVSGGLGSPQSIVVLGDFWPAWESLPWIVVIVLGSVVAAVFAALLVFVRRRG